MKKIGLIINPIAGMGGSVGLKGTDGLAHEALRLGSIPKALDKAKVFIEKISGLENLVEIVTCSGDMGENALKKYNFNARIIYFPRSENTTSSDTVEAARIMKNEDVDLLVFTGGDGTAKNIYEGAGESTTAIGIPAGVKIHSSVFAKTPGRAGELAKLFIEGKTTLTKEAEVLDIDECEYRKGNVNTRLFGYLTVPVERKFMQNKKAPSLKSEKSQQYEIANEVIRDMLEDEYYIIGPGSTTRAIMEILGLKNTLIGVDLIYNKKLIENDLSENQILKYISSSPAKIIITPTGGQGYLLGRGNQQISDKVVKTVGKDNIIIIATKDKIANLKGEPLLLDTGSNETDEMLKGYAKIITGFRETVIYKINS
ncbi:ATP-NAD kinase family protein [Sedimentibacter sp. LTW-03]